MVQVMVWQQKLRACEDRPRGRQRRQFDALLALAGLLDWPTGKGFASVADAAKGADVGEMTVKRATAWAQEAGWLRKVKRGHRLGDGSVTANEWELLLPSQQTNSPAKQTNSRSQQTNSASQQTIPTGPPSESTSPESTPPGRAVALVLERTNATAAEAAAIVRTYKANPSIRSAVAVLSHKPASELQAEVDRHRKASKPTPMPPVLPDKLPGSEPPPIWHDLRAVAGMGSRKTGSERAAS
jgi:hypothetical protein